MKKNILIIDLCHSRDSLQWNLYKKLRSNGNYNIFISQDINGEISNIMFEMNINKVDLCFIGIYADDFMLNSVNYIKLNNIPVILDQADIEEFCTSAKIKSFLNSNVVKATITRYYPSPRLDSFILSLNLPYEFVKCIPWGIEIKPLSHLFLNRDIDVSLICSITPGWKYHTEREKIKSILFKSEGIKVCAENVWGDEYYNILQRSKIFIVEGSMRQSMTQKYLEGAMAGCLLVGDRPKTPKIANELFNEEVMVEVKEWNKINEIIYESLTNANSPILAERCHKMVTENFSVNKTAQSYEQLFADLTK